VLQGFISEWIRTIIYMGEGAKNNAIGPLSLPWISPAASTREPDELPPPLSGRI
jgi:hypothetical protein